MGDFWQLTVDILQNPSNPIVDKPKLVEKYLVKPPFRYLHDIVSAVQSGTGFAPGLYQGDELVAQAIQDKDAKVTYLQKIIDVVGIVLGEHVPAKPLKIVAGLEPENTNVFLQMMGQACRISDGADAVQRVLSGEHQPEPGARSAPSQPPAAPARPSSRPSSQQRGAEDGLGMTEPPPQKAEPSPSRPKRSESMEREKKSSSRSSKTGGPPAEDTPPKLGRSDSKRREEPPALGPSEVPSAAPAGNEAMRASLMRPQSARKAPPKVAGPAPAVPAGVGGAAAGRGPAAGQRRTSNMGDRPPNAGTMPGQGVRPVAVFEEGAKGDSDDDVEVVHEAAPVALGPRAEASGEQGVLVRNILEAEKNLKKAGADAAQAAAGEESGGTGIILKRMGKPTGGAAAGAGAVRTNDTQAIRELVQKLCQSSHPLAKSMDYLQEDLENMAKEYRFWQMERRLFADKLADEQRMVTDSASAEAQVADLDGQIKQVRDRIVGLKAQILRNDDTVNKLLAMAVSGGGR